MKTQSQGAPSFLSAGPDVQSTLLENHVRVKGIPRPPRTRRAARPTPRQAAALSVRLPPLAESGQSGTHCLALKPLGARYGGSRLLSTQGRHYTYLQVLFREKKCIMYITYKHISLVLCTIRIFENKLCKLFHYNSRSQMLSKITTGCPLHFVIFTNLHPNFLNLPLGFLNLHLDFLNLHLDLYVPI
jgi:hypothetical protein